MKSETDLIREIDGAGRIHGRGRLTVLFAVFVLLGAAAFGVGIAGDQARRAWQAYLVNFVFWTGLAFGAVLVSATLTMTKARWGRPVKRLAEAPGAFLPVSFVLFWGVYLGREHIFPWLHEPLGKQAAWLNLPFLLTRDAVGLLVLTVLALALIYQSVRGDVEVVAGKGAAQCDGPELAERSLRAQSVLSPIYALLYAFILTLLSWDLIMSLDHEWVSTLFGAYYFIGSFYSALVAVLILAALAVRKDVLRKYILPKQFHDLGKLIFAFCIVTGDFFYAQFLVIWYGDLPDETKFVIKRVMTAQWQPLAWVVLVVAFAFPFVVLLSRKIKMKPVPMLVIGVVVLVGMWLERFLLVVPSTWNAAAFPLGLVEVLITLGFFGIMALCLLFFFGRYPMLPVSDPLFRESLEGDGKAEEWATFFE